MKTCNGAIEIGASGVGELRGWAHTNEAGEIEGNTLGNCDVTPGAGRVRRDFTVLGFYDPSDAGQVAAAVGQDVTVTIQPDGAGAGKPQFTGTATIFASDYSGEDADGYVGWTTRGTFISGYDASAQI